jgi:hypothetical protein
MTDQFQNLHLRKFRPLLHVKGEVKIKRGLSTCVVQSVHTVSVNVRECLIAGYLVVRVPLTLSRVRACKIVRILLFAPTVSFS